MVEQKKQRKFKRRNIIARILSEVIIKYSHIKTKKFKNNNNYNADNL